MSADAARARGQLWVGNYVRHYGEHQYREPWDMIEAARDMIEDALAYIDYLALDYYLPTDGSSQILEDITRARSSLAD